MAYAILDLKSKFGSIYSEGAWGTPAAVPGRRNQRFYSGGGTDPGNDRDGQYVKLIQEMIRRPDVNRVVEIGCGDWEVSGRVDWSGVEYLGFDVVPELLEHNRELWGAPNIQFIYDDPIGNGRVQADLLIMKDVIQHLPPDHSCNFIRSIPDNFTYNVITNDIGPANDRIDFGGYCPNSWSADPFNMSHELLLQWQQRFAEAGNKQTVRLFR
jgi:hypothetical protein